MNVKSEAVVSMFIEAHLRWVEYNTAKQYPESSYEVRRAECAVGQYQGFRDSLMALGFKMADVSAVIDCEDLTAARILAERIVAEATS